MEEECYPAISMDTASGRGGSSPTPAQSSSCPDGLTLVPTRLQSLPEGNDGVEIKGEPLSAPNSPGENAAPCQLVDDKTTITMVAPHRLHFTRNHLAQPTASDSEEDDEEYYQVTLFNYHRDVKHFYTVGLYKYENIDYQPHIRCVKI